ncbi:MAG: flagellar basal body P-ring formation chaperone FlgA [Pseudomonadota bacterium]
MTSIGHAIGGGARGSLAALGVVASLSLAALPGDAFGAEVVVAASNVPAGVVLGPEHLTLADGAPGPGLLLDREKAVGLESRVALFRGKPIRTADLAPPTLVRRNAIISLVFRRGALSIRTDGRALDAGAAGERIRIMNLDSRRTVFATVVGPNLAEAR